MVSSVVWRRRKAQMRADAYTCRTLVFPTWLSATGKEMKAQCQNRARTPLSLFILNYTVFAGFHKLSF